MADWDSQINTDVPGRAPIRPTMREREVELLPIWDNDGKGIASPEHGNAGQDINPNRINKHKLESLTDEEWAHWFSIFDEHLETFFTSRIRPTRRVSVAVPIFAGQGPFTNLPLIGGPGLITGYSLVGAATKLATFIDQKQGTNTPILNVGFDAKTVSTDVLPAPGVWYNGALLLNTNDASISGVLYIEKVMVDDAGY